jgi:hypothetical protein
MRASSYQNNRKNNTIQDIPPDDTLHPICCKCATCACQRGERTVLHSVHRWTSQPGARGADGRQRQRQEHAGHGAGRPPGSYRVASGQALLGRQGPAGAARPRARARRAVCLVPIAARRARREEQPLHPHRAQRPAPGARGLEPLDAFDFLSSAKKPPSAWACPKSMLGRPVNEGFSGGERKRNELLQLSPAAAAPGAARRNRLGHGRGRRARRRGPGAAPARAGHGLHRHLALPAE